MKPLRLLCSTALFCALTAAAAAGDLETPRFEDPAWVKEAGDHLARCAGTYRGVAEVLRGNGREQAAAYAEGVGSGALFAAYLLFTSPTARDAKVLDDLDPNVHIEALAWGTEQNLISMNRARETGSIDALKHCTQTSALQSTVLLGAAESEHAAAEPAPPLARQAAAVPDGG